MINCYVCVVFLPFSGDDEKEAELPEPPADEEQPADLQDDYDEGRCSPKLLDASEVEEGTLIYNPEDDMKRLELQRLSLRNTGKIQVLRRIVDYGWPIFRDIKFAVEWYL